MKNSSSVTNPAIPDEYRKAAEALFPPEGFRGKGPELKAAEAFAKVLGIDGEYQRLLSSKKDTSQIHEFLGHFQNNLDLLVQKTWVEKADETRKEKLQDEIPPFIALIEQGNLQPALEEFGAILEELAYLFFGAQSAGDDFTEYTFRIDPQIGLFWWYGVRLSSLKELNATGAQDAGVLWALLLIGICYLTNF
ncbi:MAG: hypothetical protein LBI28_02565 [Treponema sp.]|jgi:hypothetical protein|nr:hypothetical protein [Treponema sp.]